MCSRESRNNGSLCGVRKVKTTGTLGGGDRRGPLEKDVRNRLIEGASSEVRWAPPTNVAQQLLCSQKGIARTAPAPPILDR
jgi:hypothetical protein